MPLPVRHLPFSLSKDGVAMLPSVRSALYASAAITATFATTCAAQLVSAREPTVGRRGMVVSVCPQASRVGLQILQQGGNAVDSAVAVAFALAVSFPEAGNIGGGGFMTIHPSDGLEPVVVDYREIAPAAATRQLFTTLDSRLGHKAVGVPGTVAGLAMAHQRFGQLPWNHVVRPAVRLAERGIVLDRSLAASLNRIVSRSPSFGEFCRVYGKQCGESNWSEGDRLVQTDLARSLERIADRGAEGFYRGPTAELIAAEMQAGDGLITQTDLEGYRAKLRTPAGTKFRGFDVYCPPAPAGGPVLVEMLNILENFDLKQNGRWSVETIHIIVEAMRLAYFDRACYLADPDFASVPDSLNDKRYARELAETIDRHAAGSSEQLAGSREIALTPEGSDTTHFSVIDSGGMAVANTYTLEQSYGSRVVVSGGGFILNNEMGDFGWKPGHTDRNGTIGTEPNLIEPGKRMLSSQTPTIVAREGRAVLITGSPGGRTIINTVLQVLLSVLEFEMDLVDAVDAPRFHHQWFPDRVVFERQATMLHPQLMLDLAELGHQIAPAVTRQGDAHCIWIDRETGTFYGVADLRRKGCALGY
jgi:gamma-glutamyltranspeptidase/glutathione hydrolase